jgi:hypothetical protein
MRRRVAVAFLLVVALTAAGKSASSAKDLLVSPPPRFVPLPPPTGVDGPVTPEVLRRLTGEDGAKAVSGQELRDALADSYARSFVDQSTHDALVMFGYHLRSDKEATGFVRGALNSAESDARLKVQGGAPAGLALFAVSDPARGTNGQMALLRQGRYVYQFLVVLGAGSTSPADVALVLARAQLARLPNGSRSFQQPAGRSRTGPVVLLLVAAALLGGAVLTWRRRPKS